MTTPRPPRPGGYRRTPKIAGHTPTRPTPPAVTPPDQPTTKSRFTRAPKPSEPPVETPVVATPATDTPAVETPATDTPAAQPGAAESNTAAATSAPAAEAGGSPATATAGSTTTAPADETPTTSLTKQTPTEATGGPRGKTRPTTKVSTIKPQSTRPSAPPPVGVPATTGSTRGPLFGWRFVGIVTALAVVFGIIAGIAAIRPGVSLTDNRAFVDSAVTSEITSQANSRICTIFGLQYDKLDQWQQTAQANVTGTAAQRFGEYNKAVRDALSQAGLTSGQVDCRVDSVGVRSVEGNSAVLLVNLILSQTQGQQAAGSGTKRYQVSMQKVGDKWLISNFGDF